MAEFNGRLGRSSKQQQRRQREQQVVGERVGPTTFDRECEQDNEEGIASERKDLEGCEGDCAEVHVGVQQLRHQRCVRQVSNDLLWAMMTLGFKDFKLMNVNICGYI